MVNIHFPPEWDSLMKFETESKGWIKLDVTVKEREIRTFTFYDLTRFLQDAEYELATINGFFHIENLILVSSITQENIENALASISNEL